MKKVLSLLVAVSITAFLFSACKKETVPPVISQPGFYFRMEKDGVHWEANDTIFAIRFAGQGVEAEGVHSNSETAILDLSPPVSVGTYNVGNNSDYVFTWWGINNSDDLTTLIPGASGTITITRIDADIIEGTFDIIAVPWGAGASSHFTNGEFRCKFE